MRGRRKSEVTDDEIEAATAAYLKDEKAEPFVLKSGHRVDVAEAIEMYPRVKKLLTDKATTPDLRRTIWFLGRPGATKSRIVKAEAATPQGAGGRITTATGGLTIQWGAIV